MSFIDYLEANFSCERVGGGRQLKVSGQCPFCGEDRGDLRLYVGVDTQLGQCFHCNKGFNGILFVKAHEGCTTKQAIKIINGDPDAYIRDAGDEKPASPEPLAIFPEMVEMTFSDAACLYMMERNITVEAMKHFRLKFCPSNTMIGDKVFYTKNRIIMPIRDISGKLVSWQGRDITGRSGIRYLFPPQFKGSELLYNAHAIPTRPSYLILVEGVFDAFGWWMAGATNVIASFGKKISDYQVDMMRCIDPEVLFVAWDSDAIDKKYEFVEKYGHCFNNIKIVDLNGKDADQMDKGGLVTALEQSVAYSWGGKILGMI